MTGVSAVLSFLTLFPWMIHTLSDAKFTAKQMAFIAEQWEQVLSSYSMDHYVMGMCVSSP